MKTISYSQINDSTEYRQLPEPVQKALQTIDRKNPMPLYHQLFDLLHGVIINKELEPGSFFATENLLQEETEMSRATIRKALEELVRQKYLIRITGKGTFISIAYPENQIVLPQLKSLTQELVDRGMKPGSILLKSKIIKPTKDIAEMLNIEQDEKVLFVERIRTGNDVPILYLCSYVPINIGISEDSDIPESLYTLIEQNGKSIHSAKHIINATIISQKIAKHLGVKKSTAGLTMERVTFDTQGLPVLYEEGIFRNDLYSYTLRLEKRG